MGATNPNLLQNIVGACLFALVPIFFIIDTYVLTLFSNANTVNCSSVEFVKKSTFFNHSKLQNIVYCRLNTRQRLCLNKERIQRSVFVL